MMYKAITRQQQGFSKAGFTYMQERFCAESGVVPIQRFSCEFDT